MNPGTIDEKPEEYTIKVGDRSIRVVVDFPPIWEQVHGAGMRPDPEKVVFTYGDAIYNPSGQELPLHLVCHEETHIQQQAADPDAWWSRYMQDQYFRVDQEADAYARQYAYECRHIKDRNQRDRFLRHLARQLSSPTYGSVIGEIAAYKMIKEKSDVK